MPKAVEDEAAPVSVGKSSIEMPVAPSGAPFGMLGPRGRAHPSAERLLTLQRSAGNRATIRALKLARQPTNAPGPSAPPSSQPGAQRSDDELTAIIDEAADRSPTFLRFLTSVYRRGYIYVWGLPGSGTYTDRHNKWIVIDPTVSRQDAIVRTYYEVVNAVFDSDFEQVATQNEAHLYRTAQDYARAMLKEEAGTVVWASLEAQEAGLQLSSTWDSIVARYLEPDPAHPGGLHFKRGVEIERVIDQIFPSVWNADTVDTSGATIKARDRYMRGWRGYGSGSAP
jgi:hypothetical protein